MFYSIPIPNFLFTPKRNYFCQKNYNTPEKIVWKRVACLMNWSHGGSFSFLLKHSNFPKCSFFREEKIIFLLLFRWEIEWEEDFSFLPPFFDNADDISAGEKWSEREAHLRRGRNDHPRSFPFSWWQQPLADSCLSTKLNSASWFLHS